LVDRNFSVLSVTTIATPHRGSTFADYFLETIGQARLPQVLSLLDMLPNGGGDGKAFEFLTLENMKKFNEHTPDVEGVQYFSYGAEYEPGLIDTWKYGCPPYLCFFSVCGSTACQVSPFGSLGERGSERWIGVHYVCSLGSCSPSLYTRLLLTKLNRAHISAHSNTSTISISWGGSTPLGTNGPN